MYMRGHYKQKMAEIESQFPKSAKRPSSSTGRSGAAAAQGSSQEDRREKRRRQEEEKGNDEPAFESGFDHGFESMATFNGRSVGNEGGPAQSTSIVNAPEAAPAQNT